MARFGEREHRRTQQVGAAAAFLECDGLIVPSARWDCDNFVLFMDNHRLSNTLEVVETEEVDWQAWAREAGLLSEGG